MLRKMKSIYLESSVVSYLAARPSRDLVVAGNQQVTRDWWETRRGECDLFVSDVVVAECAAGDPTAASEREVFRTDLPVLATTEEAEALAAALLSAMALPQRAALDALHIGLDAVNWGRVENWRAYVRVRWQCPSLSLRASVRLP